MKQNILLIFGGQSSEHEVSLKSVTTIYENIDHELFDIYPVGITKEGKWLLYRGANFNFTENNWQEKGVPCILSPDVTHHGLLLLRDAQDIVNIKINKVFPIMHGKYGEDGTIQGLCTLAQLPFVGCGVLSSAISMDKSFTKIAVEKTGIRQAKYVLVKSSELKHMNQVVSKIEETFGYPYFVKPANAGSSVGINKVHNKRELEHALRVAAKEDAKILVEETIIGREVEVAVLGNEELQISGVGEILAAAEFYDFDAKYNNAESKTVICAELPDEIKENLREAAKKIYKAVDAKGLSRVDFFVTETGDMIFNEINTMPGFTKISMYPMLFEDFGISIKNLITELINLASL
ncbi:D-alanine--D-alanine ligase family protein [Candidatus Epulonipiscium viviparus]|uniref:D-alanine--D-alanine ligase family protein n=1 Tax=Candidatus Epulonipiscium viviparus TaxID=420336 RepID=UPI0004961A97|nr:D-alanine--D-alanine ligase family protein [Candidatus Epulopiscium viviparus]